MVVNQGSRVRFRQSNVMRFAESPVDVRYGFATLRLHLDYLPRIH